MKGNVVHFLLFALISLALAVMILDFYDQQLKKIEEKKQEREELDFFYDFKNALFKGCTSNYTLTARGYGTYNVNGTTICETEFNIGCFEVSCQYKWNNISFPNGVWVNVTINESNISVVAWK